MKKKLTSNAVKILHKLFIEGKKIPREKILEAEREIVKLLRELYCKQESLKELTKFVKKISKLTYYKNVRGGREIYFCSRIKSQSDTERAVIRLAKEARRLLER